MITKYQDLSFDDDIIKNDIKRLTNQVWKLIPMRENKEDWKSQLESVIIEIAGIQEVFFDQLDLLIILSSLEGLKGKEETPFMNYRKTVFSVISLLGKLI